MKGKDKQKLIESLSRVLAGSPEVEEEPLPDMSAFQPIVSTRVRVLPPPSICLYLALIYFSPYF